MMAFFGQMTVLDWLAFGGVAFLVVRGFIRGCSGEISRLIGWLAAVATGCLGFAPVERAVLAAKLFSANPYAGRLVAVMLILVICFSVGLLLRHVLKESLQTAIGQPFDAILGGIIGGFKAFVVIAVLCALGLLDPRENGAAAHLGDSFTAQKLTPLLQRVAPRLAPAPDGDTAEDSDQ